MFRILKTMQQRGFVEYDPRTETYRLGLKFLAVSRNVRDRLHLHREAEATLKALAEETGDSSYLVISTGNSAIVVDRYVGGNMLQLSAPIGTLLPYHVGAGPKILLAYMPREQREQVLQEMELPPFTPNTIRNKDKFRKLLDQICLNGYSDDAQDYEVGAYAFGAPIFDHEGSVVAAASIATPSPRCSDERRVELIGRIKQAARQISTNLGYKTMQAGMDHVANRNEFAK
jgi:DNA-binding IclR family transcriptional regulator